MSNYIVGPDGNGAWKSTRDSDSRIMFRGATMEEVFRSTEIAMVVGGERGIISVQARTGEIVDNVSIPRR